MRSIIALAFASATLLAAPTAHACFIRSPQPVQVWMDHIHVDIVDQVAVKTYDCVFKNLNSRRFVVGGTCYMELEPGAQVDNMTVTVDGKKMQAEILDVKRANKVFADIVKNGGSPALLEYYGNQLISTKIPRIKPGGTVTVKLRYTTVLKKRGNAVRLQMLNTNPKASMQPLKSAGVTVRMRSKSPIKNLYSPTHEVKFVEEKGWDVVVKWSQEKYLPKHPFVLYYTTSDYDVGATLLAHRELNEDGHFMLLLSPTLGSGAGKVTDEQILPKDVVFCVDTSGSMLQDGKMEQARKALQYCIANLRKGDRFNIVDFGTAVRTWERKLIEADDKSQSRANRHIEKLDARGGTAIHRALEQSLAQFEDNGRLKMIVFLTDGLPTIGERDPKKILKTVDKKNAHNVRLFVFGQGTDVNTRLLDFLALNHRGESEYVLPKQNSAKKIAGFFDRVGSPILTDLKVEAEGVKLTDVYPQSIPDMFRGEQFVVYGRYTGHGNKKIRITGQFNGKTKTFEYDVEFPEVSTDDRNAFVPRLWAGQKVDFLLNEIRRAEQEDMELIKEVTYLAKLYGIVTPYTSFLMTDDVATQTKRTQVRNFVSRMRSNTGGLRGQASGYGAVKNAFDQANNRANLRKQGIADKYYSQVQLALQQEGKANEQAMNCIRYVGNRTFYQSKNIWYDSRFEVAQKDKIKNVDVGSKEYLTLLKNNSWIGKCMAQGDVVLQVGKDWYRFQTRRSG